MSDERQSSENSEEVSSEEASTTHILDEEFLTEEADFSPALLETGEEGKDYSPAATLNLHILISV